MAPYQDQARPVPIAMTTKRPASPTRFHSKRIRRTLAGDNVPQRGERLRSRTPQKRIK